MDAAGGRRLLSSIRKESVDLREAVTMVVHHICQQFVDPTGLDAFTASRLVALDKCPGIRPVGMGEVVRRIIAKAVLAAAGPQVQDATAGRCNERLQLPEQTSCPSERLASLPLNCPCKSEYIPC